MVVAEWAAFLAFLTADTRPAAGTARIPTTSEAGMALRKRCLNFRAAMDLILIAGHPEGSGPIPDRTPGLL